MGLSACVSAEVGSMSSDECVGDTLAPWHASCVLARADLLSDVSAYGTANSTHGITDECAEQQPKRGEQARCEDESELWLSVSWHGRISRCGWLW